MKKYIKNTNIIFIVIFLVLSCTKTEDIKERNNLFDPDAENYSPPDLIIYLNDYYNGKNVFGAKLTMDGKEAQYTSTEKYYKFRNIALGNYTLNISCEGFYSDYTDISLNDINDKTITIKLKPHYRFLKKWGTKGSGQGQFNEPLDLCVERETVEYVYVSDYYNDRIQKFDTDGNYITEFSHASFYTIGGLCYLNGHIYIVERFAWNIYDFFANGTFNQNWNYGVCNEDIIGYGSYLYIDSINNIIKCNLNGTKITNVDSIVNNSYGITVDSFGNIIVVDKTCIKKLDNDFNLIKQWGDFTFLTSVATDGNDNIYVTEGQYGIIKKYSSDGMLISSWGNNGSGDVELNYPHGIDIDSNGNVYIVERYNHRVVVYSPVQN